MEFSFKNHNRILGELTVKDGNTVISQDVVGSMGEIDKGLIDNLTDVAIEMVQFQKQDLIDYFFDKIHEYLGAGEIEELAERLNPSQEEE